MGKLQETLSKIVSGSEISENIHELIKDHESRQRSKKSHSKSFVTSNTTMKRNEIATEPKKLISTTADSDRPGPSTTNINTSESETEIDSEIDPSELCCKCGRFQPKELKNCVSQVFSSWAQCDSCQHWVHLKYCTSVRVVGRADMFKCHHYQ